MEAETVVSGYAIRDTYIALRDMGSGGNSRLLGADFVRLTLAELYQPASAFDNTFLREKEELKTRYFCVLPGYFREAENHNSMCGAKTPQREQHRVHQIEALTSR